MLRGYKGEMRPWPGRACLRQVGLRDALTGLGGYAITNAYDYWDGVVYPAGALGIKHGLG
jgi:hypothetical protein